MVSKANMADETLTPAVAAASSSNTTTNTTTQFFSAPAPFPHIFTAPIHFKLEEGNYLIWQQQVMATLRSLNLTQFLDAACTPPRLSSAADESTSTFSPVFLSFER